MNPTGTTGPVRSATVRVRRSVVPALRAAVTVRRAAVPRPADACPIGHWTAHPIGRARAVSDATPQQVDPARGARQCGEGDGRPLAAPAHALRHPVSTNAVEQTP